MVLHEDESIILIRLKRKRLVEKQIRAFLSDDLNTRVHINEADREIVFAPMARTEQQAFPVRTSDHRWLCGIAIEFTFLVARETWIKETLAELAQLVDGAHLHFVGGILRNNVDCDATITFAIIPSEPEDGALAASEQVFVLKWNKIAGDFQYSLYAIPLQLLRVNEKL